MLASASPPGVLRSDQSFDAASGLVALNAAVALQPPRSASPLTHKVALQAPRSCSPLVPTGKRSLEKASLPDARRPRLDEQPRSHEQLRMPLPAFRFKHFTPSSELRSKHEQWQSSLRAALKDSPQSTYVLCAPATWLGPIESMLVLRALRPEQVASLSPPAVSQLVSAFRTRSELLVYGNPKLRDALRPAAAATPQPHALLSAAAMARTRS